MGYRLPWASADAVVGFYGLLYLHAARRMEIARPIIAAGLLGKVLGPVGLAIAVSLGELPARVLTLAVVTGFI